MSAVIHVKLTPKKPTSAPDEPPPAYAAALALPPPDAPASRPSSRRQSLEFAERIRRSSITEENEADREAEGGGADWDAADEAYSMDDETFEPYDEDPVSDDETARDARGAWSPMEIPQDDEEPVTNNTTTAGACIARHAKRRSPHRLVSPRRHWSTKSEPPTAPREVGAADAPALQYDAQTFSIVSKLRALNRQLTQQLEQQAKHVQRLQDEKRQHLAQIQTLEKDLRTVKHTLKTMQAAVQGGPADRMVVLRSPARRSKLSQDTSEDLPPPYASLDDTQSGDRVELPHVAGGGVGPHPPPPRRRSPRSPPPPEPVTPRPATTPCRTTVASPRGKREGSPRLATAPARASSPVSSWSPDRAKIEKLEQDKRDLLHRHAHQLANYSHELSRLERQVENAQKLVQAKDYELRLQKSRQLYACCSGSEGGGGGSKDLITTSGSGSSQRHHHHATLLSDALWRELLPSPAAPLSLPFTSHVGLAFEQLLGHQLLSFHDRMVDATTRDWLHEIRCCGAQVLQLHHSFQCMTQTFKALAQCCHIYELAEAFTKEVKQLCKAEQAFLFVMDPAENEFWCRVPRPGEGHGLGGAASDLITVRSRVMPLAGTGGVSAVAAEHTGTTAQNTALLAAAAAPGAVHVPCGLASWVFHTKKPLLVPAGHVTRHPHYSTAPDNTDRLMAFKSASTLLLPVVQGGTTLGVIQVCGKLTQVAALGVAISLEKCEAFTREDQVVLTMLSHFLGGVLPKAAYFTEVESNKVNEETLIQLAPEIFTCLRFEELGKIVIQNAKQVLDADRCSLFVADNDDRMLYNWQSDISGKGGVEVVNDVKKSTMRVPFGHGIVGMVAETRQLINIPDAYEDPRFNSSWDKKTNYRTKSILTVPILSTTHAASKAPIRRRRSQHDVYGAVITDPSEQSHQGGSNNATPDADAAQASGKQTLLGVVQVINKSGGAPFRSKDEFLLQTISKLIALAIENSQLFQKTQELCASLGKLIADADLAEAVATLSACAEDIIGVESAAVYVLSGDPGAPRDLVTFHRKRRHKIVVKEHMYRHSLLERALRSRELVIANDLSSPVNAGFNAYVDSIGGLVARNALFMPLLIDDPEDATQTSKKLVGLLHLVNTRGRKLAFERFDLFLSIVGSQTCSVVASILEKQALLRQQEQTKHLLDTTLSFFKEMSPVGIINAVYNTCASLFGVEKAHLFLWEPDRRAMWTAKLTPGAEQASAAALKTSASSPGVLSGDVTGASPSTTPSGAAGGGGGGAGHAPSLRAQARRISVLTDQKIRVPTSEGLLEHVLGKGAMVVVKHWVDVISETHGDDHDHDHDHEPDTDAASDEAAMTATASVSVPSSIEVSKYALRASRADYKAGFTRHAVVACPVWDIYGQEIVGVVVLLYPKSKAPAPQELGNLPNLSRQISGALNVCGDLRAVTQRCQTVQALAEGFTPRRVPPTASLTLSARGQLVAFSQPLNVATPGFSASALFQYSARTSSLGGAALGNALTALDLARLPLDEDGHRWVFALSGASLQAMTSEHFVNWIGKDVGAGTATAHAFDRLRTDLQSVLVRKETVQGELSLPSAAPALRSGFELSVGGDGGHRGGGGIRGGEAALPKPVVFQLRLLLWEFADAQAWQIDVKRACRMFDAVDPSRSRLVSRANVELALTTHGRGVELDALEWDLVHEAFAADAASDLVDVDRMVRALAPRFKSWSRVAYELIPVLDSITQSVVNVHVLLTALDAP